MSDYPLSPLRQIKLFFPPIDSPSLTTYLRSIRPKLNPLKQKYCVFSQMKEKSVCDNPETVYMSSSDIDIVASSYKKIKRSRGQSVLSKLSQFEKDPLYKSIYEMKHKSIMQTRAKSKKRIHDQ